MAVSPTKGAGQPKAKSEPAVYGLAGWCVRGWLDLFGRPVRVLGSERLPDSAAILHIRHDASFADAVALTASSPRRVTCLISRRQLRGLQPLVASSLGMVCYETEAARWHSALRTCTRILASGGIIAAFQESEAGEAGEAEGHTGLSLAQEGWLSAFPEARSVILPVHRFRPPAKHEEYLIHVGVPSGAAEVEEQAGLRAAGAKWDENVFLIEAPILDRLLRDFEQALREQLQKQWASGPARNQKVDGFRLSPGAAETLRRVNRAEPETLLELRQLLDAEREDRRECSLARLRAQRGRNQLPAIWRALIWIETVLGFLPACYGALNHALAGLFLALFNLARRGKPSPGWTWGVRAAIILLCYIVQILLVDRLMGRAAAGYYAVTLPVSGAYLWRYWWLLRRRTRILLLGVRATTLAALAERKRERFLQRLRAILDAGIKPVKAAQSQ